MRRKEEGERMKREVVKQMMLEAYEESQRVKAERMKREAAEDDAFEEAMLAKFAEEDKSEKLSAQLRRTKQMEHKRKVERLLEEQRAAYEQQRLAEAEERDIEERAGGLTDLG